MGTNDHASLYSQEQHDGTYAVTLTPDSKSLLSEIVGAVATLEEASPLELPPLYETVDPEALEAVCESFRSSPDAAGRLTFEYAGYAVTIDAEASDPRLVVDPIE